MIETGFVGAAAILSLPPPNQGYQHDALAPRLLANETAGFVAVQFRQADIEQDQMAFSSVYRIECPSLWESVKVK